MKKVSLFVATLSLLLLTGCNSSNGFNSASTNNFVQEDQKGELSSFNLLTPSEGQVVVATPTFTWESSSNAYTYTLEIATTPQFYNDVETEYYYRQANIIDTNFTIHSALSKKNATYYWKVTAINKTSTLECSEVKTFFVKSDDKEEVKIDIGEKEDWQLHDAGSYAKIDIDRNNFFGNNEKSLVIAFDKEHTNQGIPTSDGWVIVTKTVEKDLYGTDSLLFDFYYSGNDAKVLVRLIDNDNEYWYAPVQISNNAKQTVILKFSDFVQRFADVTVANQTFNYEHIKYMEIVFEKSFGDGVCLVSNVRAVRYQNYSNLFIDTVHFDQYPESSYTYESYNFGRTINQDELTLSYTTGINSYGFVKLETNQYLVNGDTIQMKVKYTGSKGTNVLMRVYEQDKDRWSFKLPFSSLIEDEYVIVNMPYQAFAKSMISGDGSRQFYYIINLQFGLEGEYGTGTLSFKDVKVVYKDDVADTTALEVTSDGIIDTFDTYTNSGELYYKWRVSETNKDEMMSLNTTKKVGGASNKQCIQLEYKSDMGPATYTLPLDIKDYSFTSIRVSLKDASIKSSEYSHLKDAHPEFGVVLTLKTGEEYRYMIDALDSYWYEYVIPFDAFTLANEVAGTPQRISPEGIGYITLAMQYFYYDQSGKANPAYTQSNPVYVDTLMLGKDTEVKKNSKERVITPSSSDINKSLIDDFESDDSLNYWSYGNTVTYNELTLSNDVSSLGGSSSLRLKYQGSTSPSYQMIASVDSKVTAKGIFIDIKGDDKATVYINIYATISGTTHQFRATLPGVSSSWNTYKIGFDNFACLTSSSLKLTKDRIVYFEKMTFGIVNSSSPDASYIYIDSILFDGTMSYSANTKTLIA